VNSPGLGRDVNADADRQLLAAIAGGSADALGRFYDRHAALVFGMARRILTRPEDAEEVVQDVFAQVWRRAATYSAERATVPGWLVMLTRTRAIDRLRSRRARPDQDRGLDLEPSSAPPLAADVRTPEQAAAATERAGRIRRAMAALPDAQRALVELAFFEGLTHTELADRTSTPLGTVKTRLRTAMSTLRAALSREAGPVTDS
jgi:RNA polymerase sigma-70 factor (ECF subfamily)